MRQIHARQSRGRDRTRGVFPEILAGFVATFCRCRSSDVAGWSGGDKPSARRRVARAQPCPW